MPDKVNLQSSVCSTLAVSVVRVVVEFSYACHEIADDTSLPFRFAQIQNTVKH